MQLDDKKMGEMMEAAGKYNNMSALTYRNGELISCYEHQKYAKEYLEKYSEQFWSSELPISIIYTNEDVYLTVMKVSDYVVIGGPVTELPITNNMIDKISKLLGDDKVISNISCIPVSSVVMMICIAYHQMTGIKLNESEILTKGRIHADKSNNMDMKWKSFYELDSNMIMYEMLYQFEKKIIQIIKLGTEEEIEKIVSEFAGEIPQKGPYHLRHYKNLFTTAATIISRAAVEFGVAPAESFALADFFINKCESIKEHSMIANLLVKMMKNYRLIIRTQSEQTNHTEFVRKVISYIQMHISEKISVEQMAYDLGMSRNSLSGKFRKETGYILSEYILMKKIQRAKYLISMTDYSFAEISAYLGFSSQSHFQRTFKKYADMTPGEFKYKM